jgi:uncharacterized protein with NAD-binding domain and iron-sulfur cluster
VEPSLAQLEKEAALRVQRVANDPNGRKALRVSFYNKYGYPILKYSEGFGNSEIEFMDWEIARGVLNPVQAGRPGSGSPWWREVNLRFIYMGELARLVWEQAPDLQQLPHGVVQWLRYIQNPSGQTWYRAHNTNIVQAYLDAVALAQAENRFEQVFVNEVLYRLLFAQAMEEDPNWLVQLMGNPKLPAVEVITHLQCFYPIHYPLTKADDMHVLHIGTSLQELAVDVMDEVVILPRLQELYQAAAGWLQLPALVTLQQNNKPVYPNITPVPPSQPLPMMQPTKPEKPKKVAILGSGMSALAAAHALTSYPNWQDYYDISIYQMGWRVGGKTSTGRGPYGRIQEHGIHILQGWYESTFQLIRAVYAERKAGNLDPNSPFQEWTDAFVRDNATLLTEYLPSKRVWLNWPMIFPTNNYLPGDGSPLPVSAILQKVFALGLEAVLGSPYKERHGWLGKLITKFLQRFFPPPGDGAVPPPPPPTRVRPLFAAALDHHTRANYAKPGEHAAAAHLRHAAALAQQLGTPANQLPTVAGTTADKALPELLYSALLAVHETHRVNPTNDYWRRLATLIEFGYVNVKGLLEDVVDWKTWTLDLDKINPFDYRQWIAKHGASQLLLQSTPVRFLYTGTFSNLHGPDQCGLLAAGTGLGFLIQSIGYKGSFVWKFKAGSGDSMVMPLYQVLKARGVKFKFFHKVQEVLPTADGAGIATIVMQRQVDLKDPTKPYEPTITVKNVAAWPAEPLYDQLNPQQAAQLQAQNIDLECAWSPWQPMQVYNMQQGVDFDECILAIPIEALRGPQGIARKLIEQNTAWQNMAAQVQTVPTLAAQLWMKPTLLELGMDTNAWGLGPNAAPNLVTYANLMYSWIDMTFVVPQEDWPTAHTPGQLTYFTGTLPLDAPPPPYSDSTYPADQLNRVMLLTEQWLHDYMGWFWQRGIRLPEWPQAMDLDNILCLQNPAAKGLDRLKQQFWRANVNPTDRYTSSLPGTGAARLAPGQSGYAHLTLAGDWTNFGLNVGYIEGAIISGLQAASALRLGMQLPIADNAPLQPQTMRL